MPYTTSVVSIGFAEPTYTALEDGGSVQVCLELCEGSINRPIDVLLYTDDGTALGEYYHIRTNTHTHLTKLIT